MKTTNLKNKIQSYLLCYLFGEDLQYTWLKIEVL
jgi:hypothetical protein